MDGAQNAIEPDTVLHGQGELGQDLATAGPHDQCAQNAIPTGHGQYLDKALGRILGNGPVQIRQLIPGHFVSNTPGSCFRFTEANPGHLRRGKDHPGQYPVIHAKTAKLAEQTVHRRVPGLM